MATNWKKILQAGAYATDALSKGSAGGLGKALVDSKIDLSGKNAFDEQNTEDNAGKKAKKYGGQGNKRRNTSYKEIE